MTRFGRRATLLAAVWAWACLCASPSAWGGVDLIVSEIRFSDEQPIEGDSVTIVAVIENIGDEPLTSHHDISAWIYEDDPDAGGLQLKVLNELAGLAPGKPKEIVARFRPRAGRWNVHAVVNPEPSSVKYRETNLNNNEASRELVAGPRIFPSSTPEERKKAVERAVKWLLNEQGELSVKCPQDGMLNPKIEKRCVICQLSLSGIPVRKKPKPAWNPIGGSAADTALAVLTLLAADLSPSDEAVDSALQYLLEADWNLFSVYDYALVTLAFTATQQPEKYMERVQFAVNRLGELQIKEESGAPRDSVGGWGYGRIAAADGAHMHYVVYALYAARLWGAEVDREVLKRAENWVRRAQHAGGGWNYSLSVPSPWAEGPYGSMTATGLMALKMLGAPPSDEAFQRGVDWINRYYSAASNPGSFSFHYYYLLAVQRAMDAPPKQASLAGREWFEEMANVFVATQRSDGSWEDADGEMFGATCFGILFLTRYTPKAVAPDLSIAPSSLRLTPSAPAAGEDAAVRATVLNAGKPVDSLVALVAVYDGHPDQGGLRLAEQEMLFPKNRADMTGDIVWKVPREGEYNIYLKVDPDDSFEDLDRSNNTASLQVKAAAEGTAAQGRKHAMREIAPKVHEIGPVDRAVLLDRNRMEIRIKGKSVASSRLVEYLATTPLGKVHETVLTLDIEPVHLQVALLALGLKPENNLRQQGDPRVPKGSPVDIFVEWERNDKTERRRAEELIWNGSENRPMNETPWVFTGSYLKEGKLFMADATQSLIASFRDPAAILNHPLPAGADDTVYRANLSVVPPNGFPVELIIRPADAP